MSDQNPTTSECPASSDFDANDTRLYALIIGKFSTPNVCPDCGRKLILVDHSPEGTTSGDAELYAVHDDVDGKPGPPHECGPPVLIFTLD